MIAVHENINTTTISLQIDTKLPVASRDSPDRCSLVIGASYCPTYSDQIYTDELCSTIKKKVRMTSEPQCGWLETLIYCRANQG